MTEEMLNRMEKNAEMFEKALVYFEKIRREMYKQNLKILNKLRECLDAK